MHDTLRRERLRPGSVITAVVATTAVIAAATACDSGSARRSPAPTTRVTTATAVSRPVPAPSATPTRSATPAPWGAVRIGPPWAVGTRVGLFADAWGLVSVSAGSTTVVRRIDPATGRAGPGRAVSDAAAGALPTAALAGRSLWVASAPRDGWVVVSQVSGPDLSTTRSVRVAVDVARGAVVTLAADADSVYVGAGRAVSRIATATGSVIDHLFTTSAPVEALSVTADDSRLYVAAGTGYDSTDDNAALFVVDTSSGSVVRSAGGSRRLGQRAAYLGRVVQLVATLGGVWVVAATGSRSTQVGGFLPARLAGRVHGLTSMSGGGGPYATVSIAGHTAWVGGGVAGTTCADPDTGAPRARVTDAQSGLFSDVVTTGRRWYALDSDDNLVSVVRIYPPARCTQ